MTSVLKPILAAGLVAVALAGPAAAQSPDDAAGGPSPDTVLARVNGSEITLADLLIARERMPEQFRQVPVQAIYPLLVNGLIDSRLAVAEARRRNLQDDDKVRDLMRRFEDQVIERILVETYVNEHMTDERLRAEYDKLVAAEQGKTELHARHILLEDKETAEQMIRQLDGGAEFAALAEQHSTGPSAPRGGDLGWRTEGELIPEFETAAKALPPGTYTKQPLQTRYGWHVIRLEGLRDSTPPTFEEAERELKMRVTRQLADQLVTELRSGASIERFELDGAPTE